MNFMQFFFHTRANALIVNPCAKFCCNRATNNKDIMRRAANLKMSKKPSPIRVKTSTYLFIRNVRILPYNVHVNFCENRIDLLCSFCSKREQIVCSCCEYQFNLFYGWPWPVKHKSLEKMCSESCHESCPEFSILS